MYSAALFTAIKTAGDPEICYWGQGDFHVIEYYIETDNGALHVLTRKVLKEASESQNQKQNNSKTGSLPVILMEKRRNSVMFAKVYRKEKLRKGRN